MFRNTKRNMAKAPPAVKKQQRWYFGGVASAAAACITHPLDTLKVHMQTQQGKASMVKLCGEVIKNHGVLALYNGLTASLARQLTYSTARFAIYEALKNHLSPHGEKIPLTMMIGAAGVAGGIGGFIGTPPDLVNVRMQNDIKLPPDQRRNYKHALHGLWRVYLEEGIIKSFKGGGTASARAALMSVGQLSTYDIIKMFLLKLDAFEDNIVTHFTASLGAGGCATLLTQPLDVIKTRLMNAKPGEFKGIGEVVMSIGKGGPLGFFKGFVPAFIRLGPQTILVFVFLEVLTDHFGYIKT